MPVMHKMISLIYSTQKIRESSIPTMTMKESEEERSMSTEMKLEMPRKTKVRPIVKEHTQTVILNSQRSFQKKELKVKSLQE